LRQVLRLSRKDSWIVAQRSGPASDRLSAWERHQEWLRTLGGRSERFELVELPGQPWGCLLRVASDEAVREVAG
jgi:hypothetical protein